MSPDTAPRVLDQNARTNRALRRLAGVAIALALLLNAITAGVVAVEAFGARAQAGYNYDVLRIILAVTGCTIDDPPDVCARRQHDRNVAEGTRRIVEVDCVTRRALAGLSAPDPKQFCTAQTPPHVYPG